MASSATEAGAGQRCIHDRDALGFGIFMVNGVETDATAHDHLEVGANVDQRLADLGPRTNDHSIIGGQEQSEVLPG